MKNSNMIIRIPEPCHEDWNKMQPDDKGKYCGSCCKSVVDFSNKSDTEIRDILMEYKGQKVCGHFKKEQVDRPLSITINLKDLPRNVSATRAFAIAALLVFGTMLFSCTNDKNEKVGMIAVENTEVQSTMGEIAPPQQMVTTDTLFTVPLVTEQICSESFIKGDVAPEQYIDGGIHVEEIQAPDTVANVQKVPQQFMLGAMVYSYQPDSTFIQTDSSYVTDPDKNPETIADKKVGDKKNPDHASLNKKISLSVFPNPGSGEFTIKYDVLKRSNVKVDVLDMRGVVLRTIVNVQNHHEGKYNVPVNLSELPTGMYIVNLINNGERITSKLLIEK